MTKAERYREWARNNREKLRANNRRYYQKNKKSISDKNAARARVAWPATRDVRYGLSSGQYDSHAKDNAEVLRRAADYLQAHGAAVPGTATRDDV